MGTGIITRAVDGADTATMPLSQGRRTGLASPACPVQARLGQDLRHGHVNVPTHKTLAHKKRVEAEAAGPVVGQPSTASNLSFRLIAARTLMAWFIALIFPSLRDSHSLYLPMFWLSSALSDWSRLSARRMR